MAGTGNSMKQLIKGIVIGVVLILAIMGTMSILDKNTSTVSEQTNTANEVSAPSITLTESKSPVPKSTSDPIVPMTKISLDDPNEKSSEESSDKKALENGFKPVLENEKSPEAIANEAKSKESTSKEPKAIQYGMLRLASIDYETKNSLKASYQVFDKDNKKIAEKKDSDQSSLRLPVGQYKVISTLTPPSGATRKTDPVQSTQFITITADTVTQKLFKMEPPSIIGVLQVSAKNAKTNQVMRASYIIQKENGETVAQRENVTNTLFKLNAGSYKVTVRSGNNTDFRTVVIDAGESTKQVFSLQEAYLQGRVLVRVFDTFSNKPVLADISISTAAGEVVQALTSVTKTELSLPQGNYKIGIKGPYGESNKNIQVIAGQAISEVFRVDAPEKNTDSNNASQNNQTTKIVPAHQTENVSNGSTTTTTPSNDALTGTLSLFAQSQNNKTPIKSNFYVQTLSGQHIQRKIYSDSAGFKLKAGTYKVTVRAKGKKNSVRNIQVFPNKNIREIFSLLRVNQKNNTSNSHSTSQTQVKLGSSTPPPKQKVVRNGFLQVSMVPPRNTHFIIRNIAGKKIVELTSVPNGKFKLDTGVYNVTAILNGKHINKKITVRSNTTSQVSFKGNSFQQPTKTVKTGILRSRIIDQTGRPIKGNLVVTNLKGRIIAQSNNVAVGVFKLPPFPHVVTVKYRGLQGSERVKIITGETTMQTFTIAP